MSNRPSWKMTRVPWEREVSIWERMALGENDSQVGNWLDTQGHSLDRETLARLRQELAGLPEAVARLLPEVVRLFRRQLRGETATTPLELPLMSQLALVEKIKAHWGDLLVPLRSSQGLTVFALAGREILTWLLELDAPNWQIPGGRVYRDQNDQLSVTLDLEQSEEYGLLRQHLPDHPIWTAISGYTQATLVDLTARRDLLNLVLDHLRDHLAVPVVKERELDPPSGPYLHVNFAGTLYELVFRRVSGLPWNPVSKADIWGAGEGAISLAGLPLSFHFSSDLGNMAISLLLQGPELLANSLVAQTAGQAYRRAEQQSREFNAVNAQLLSETQPPTGSCCNQCGEWQEALGVVP